MLDHAVLVRAQTGAVIRRHHHQHAGAGFRRFARTFRRDARGEMTTGRDHRHAAGHVREAKIRERVALRVRQQELLGIIRENADAVDALVDHAIEHAALAVEIDVAVFGERRRRDRKHAGITGRRHCNPLLRNSNIFNPPKDRAAAAPAATAAGLPPGRTRTTRQARASSGCRPAGSTRRSTIRPWT